jgi:hypothetical protein
MGRLATLLALSAAALSAACGGSAQAQVMMPDATPLAVPAAPSHIVVPAAPEPAPAPVVETPAQQANPPAGTTGGATRPKTDPPPVKPVAPPPQPSTPQTQAPPTPTPLPAAPNQGELEQQARALKDAADQALDKIDYRGLSADGKAQWDTAKRFLKQADDALKARNIVYAWQLANKANTIATLLK